MSQYDPLKLYLTNIPLFHREVALSFKEVEEILDNSYPHRHIIIVPGVGMITPMGHIHKHELKQVGK